MARRAFVLLALVLFLAPAGIGVGAALAPDTGATTPVAQTAPNTTSVESAYSIEELRRQGSKPDTDSPDSVRKLDTYTSMAVRYDGVGLLHQTDMFMEPGGTVRRDEVHLDSIRYGQPSTEETLVMVFWEPAQRQVSAGNGNGTVARTVAVNQTVSRQQITIPENRNRATVSLPTHSENTQVTMWIAGNPDVRWHFSHHSVPFAQSVLINSAGDFWERALIQLAFPTLAVCGFAGFAVPASIKKAGAGPQWGLLPWLIILGFVAFFGLLFASVWLSSVIVALPFVVPLTIGGLVGIVFLERYEDGVKKVVLHRMDTEASRTPSGDIAREGIAGQFQTIKITKMSDGRLAVIPTGLRAYIARVFGGAAILHGASRIKSEIDLYDSPADKMLYVATDADTLVDIEPEHLVFRPPIYDDDGDLDIGGVLEAIVVFAVPAAVFFLLIGPLVGLLAGLLGCVLMFTEAHHGTARIMPATGHTDDAYATAMYLEKSLEEYETFEGLIQALRSEKNRSEDILEMIEEQGAEALIKRAHDREDPEELDDLWSDSAKGVKEEA